jgi:hypothetical protein
MVDVRCSMFDGCWSMVDGRWALSSMFDGRWAMDDRWDDWWDDELVMGQLSDVLDERWACRLDARAMCRTSDWPDKQTLCWTS